MEKYTSKDPTNALDAAIDTAPTEQWSEAQLAAHFNFGDPLGVPGAKCATPEIYDRCTDSGMLASEWWQSPPENT